MSEKRVSYYWTSRHGLSHASATRRRTPPSYRPAPKRDSPVQQGYPPKRNTRVFVI